MRTNKIVAFLAASCIAMGGAVAWAGTSNVNYNTTVGPFNGSGYTSYQTKAISGTNGYMGSATVGGSYRVDARMTGGGSWTRDITDNRNYYLYNNISKGAGTRVQFSNDATTPVHVQVTGYWRSN